MIAELRSMADVDALAARWAVGTVETNHTASEDAGHIQDVNQIGSILDFANRKIDFLVESLIAVGTITMIAGDSGCGKSTFSTAVCGAVATGKPFAGLATQQRPVLILDRENPLSIVVDRFTRLGVSDSKTFKVWGGWADDEAPSPGSPVIQRWVESCDPKPLILVDSLIAFLDGDENDARQSREFMQQLRRLVFGHGRDRGRLASLRQGGNLKRLSRFERLQSGHRYRVSHGQHGRSHAAFSGSFESV